MGFHLGNEAVTLDFNGTFEPGQLRRIETEANEAVAANLEIRVEYPTREELAALEYRSKKELAGQVRIVTVPGYDVCACCAPHVSRTGEIGRLSWWSSQLQGRNPCNNGMWFPGSGGLPDEGGQCAGDFPAFVCKAL